MSALSSLAWMFSWGCLAMAVLAWLLTRGERRLLALLALAGFTFVLADLKGYL